MFKKKSKNNPKNTKAQVVLSQMEKLTLSSAFTALIGIIAALIVHFSCTDLWNEYLKLKADLNKTLQDNQLFCDKLNQIIMDKLKNNKSWILLHNFI